MGTSLVTSSDAPTLGGVYKLVELEGRPVMKTSRGKLTLPGRHQVFRDDLRDVIGLVGEALPGERLLQPVMRDGQVVAAVVAGGDPGSRPHPSGQPAAGDARAA